MTDQRKMMKMFHDYHHHHASDEDTTAKAVYEIISGNNKSTVKTWTKL
jgi:hypothetical protein